MFKAIARTFLTLFFALGAMPAAAGSVTAIDVHQAHAMARQGALMIDVREVHEYTEVRAPGALLIPLAQFKGRISEFRMFENRPVVVICRAGLRSGEAAEALARQGFRMVHNVQGGMQAWERAGLPVERR